MNDIHPSSIVADNAVIGDNVEIGPYCRVGAGVKLGDGCRLISHVVIDGPDTVVGSSNTFYPFSIIGADPQVIDPGQHQTRTVIGDRNTFRESVSVHRSAVEGGETRIGNDNLLMTYVHVAHDCSLGSNNVLASYVGLSGHVGVGDHVTLGGRSGVVQRCRVGSYSYIGGASVIDKDVPPYFAGYGVRSTVKRVNIVGLKRQGFRREAIRAIVDAHQIYFRSDLRKVEALQQIRETLGDVEEVQLFLAFFDAVDGEKDDSKD